ncbi:MAG: alpha/beta hydrolase [Proteobacteria bacterium]|nr:alpha/beta hydrolase [Pseudomonadota bacterium]
MRREDVEFKSQGTTIRGHLYLPESPGPHPAVVMAGGWCYVKELVQPEYAKVFAGAGVAALVFDYRGFGESAGEPRQHIDPWAQIEDYKNAISWVETREDLDSERIGIWGISYSGGHVLIVAATDPRVRCVVSNIPVVDGWLTMQQVHGALGFRELEARILEDRRKRLAGGELGTLSMSTAEPARELATWPFPEVTSAFLQLKETVAPLHEHWNTVASVELLMSYDVRPFLRRILSTPVLMSVAERDDITLWEAETEVFNRIATPEKRLFLCRDTSHMTLYSNRSRLEILAEEGRRFLVEQLVAPYA